MLTKRAKQKNVEQEQKKIMLNKSKRKECWTKEQKKRMQAEYFQKKPPCVFVTVRARGQVEIMLCKQVLKMMVGNNLKDTQLQQIVDKTILLYDKVFF